MSLWSWMGGQGHVDNIHGDGSFPLSATTTVFNVLQALMHSNSSADSDSGNRHPYGVFMDAAMAILIMTIGKHAYRFMSETWPSWTLDRLRSFLAIRTTEDAAAVDVFKNQPEEFVFDNELLVLAIERYVSHLLYLEKEAQQGDSDTENINNQHAAKLTAKLLHRAEYCYRPKALYNGVYRSAVEILQRNFRLFMRPVDGDVIEVEPGLTVCFQQQVVSVSALKKCKIIPRRGRKPLMDVFIPLNFDTAVKGYTRKGGCDKAENVDGDIDDVNLDANNINNNNNDSNRSITGSSESSNDTNDRYNASNPGKNAQEVYVNQAILQCTDTSEMGKERIMDFAKRAYAWYIPKVTEPEERYYFLPSASELQHALGLWAQQSSGGHQFLSMRRFVLSPSGCSFRNLFFQNKTQLLSLVEDFKEKQGKFALPGVVHQLVILLHGEPGTGKSSVARNIAVFLDRHIVAVPIGFVQTDSTLRGILSGGVVMLDGVAGAEDDDDEVSLQFKALQTQKIDVDKVVYVFEDVEAISDMLSFQTVLQHQPMPFGSESTEKEEEEESEEEESEEKEKSSADDSENKTGSGSNTTESQSFEDSSDQSLAADAFKKYKNTLLSDFLSPEGFIAALDATLAPPGRVIIFTTNCVDRLPDFFWRPGLLTLTVHMDNLTAAAAMELVEHYCSASLTPPLRARLAALFAHCEAEAVAEVMNPAALVHVLSMCDDVEDVLKELGRFC